MFWKQALAVFAAAFLAQSLVYAVIRWHNPQEVIDGDTPSYFACAEDFKASGNFDSAACSVRTPVYPFLLAVTGTSFKNVAPAIRLNHFFAAVVGVLFYFLLLPFGGSRGAFVWAVLFSMDALILRYSNTLMTEMPFLFLWALSWGFLLRGVATGRWFLPLAVCGLLQAAAILTKPVALFWPVVQTACLLACGGIFAKEHRRRVLMNLAGILVYGTVALGVPQLWAYHNWKVHGYGSVSRVGMDVLHHKSVMILMMDLGVSQDEAHEILNRRFREKGARGDISDMEREKLYKNVLLETARRHPMGFFKATVRSVRRVLFRGAVPEFAAKGQTGRTLHGVLNYFNVGWNVLLGLLALTFFYFRRKNPLFQNDAFKKFVLLLCILSILYFTLMVNPHGNARYRFPIVPAIYFLGALGFHELREAWRARYNLKGQPHDLRAVSSAG